jgi:hypothetical protein
MQSYTSLTLFVYHGILKIIISDRGFIFVARFLDQLHDSLATHLICSSAYHPQTDGQTDRVNQIIEDMLRACALNDGSKWDQHLSLVEFSYNNNYQESIKMSSFEALYENSCRTSLSWSESVASHIWSRHCDNSRRESEVNPCKHID